MTRIKRVAKREVLMAKKIIRKFTWPKSLKAKKRMKRVASGAGSMEKKRERKECMRVRKDTTSLCMTCKLCNGVWNEATTITVCLHTFCRKCIYDKIKDEELKCCPECSVDLGDNPLEKLRRDHMLQDLRDKIFPLEREPAIARRKGRSLSSLVAITPWACTLAAMMRRRKANGFQSLRAREIGHSHAEPQEANLDPWKPLNELANAANRSESFKFHVKVKDKKISISPQDVLDATDLELFCKDSIWFSLIASENQEGDAPLPQVPSSHIKVKDGSVPVSSIQKYLTEKLDLQSEDEVEITCMGQPVLPKLQVQDLVELWVDLASTGDGISANIGCSAKDFIMVLNYGRKVPHP